LDFSALEITFSISKNYILLNYRKMAFFQSKTTFFPLPKNHIHKPLSTNPKTQLSVTAPTPNSINKTALSSRQKLTGLPLLGARSDPYPNIHIRQFRIGVVEIWKTQNLMNITM
jgi:hypothetical protein